ncbi:UNVERIFIED_CONTAM: Proliferation-associated protein 2G4 [Siphonaria sp. JEL0065]|nr:Proliferation-associated protein 2G4 [Siphonaria sp. JEL0065]
MADTVATPKVEENENALVADTVTKYQTAADVANKALNAVIAALVPGAKVNEVTKLGDTAILEGVKSVYKQKKDLVKGIAFPTCVSPGNVICHLAPIASDAATVPALAEGDVVRIELGAQIDGFAALVAHTHVVGASKTAPVTGKKADLIAAAHYATEAALRLLKPGKNNYDVTDAISKVAADFGVTPVQGMQSHQLKRNEIAGNNSKRIILNPSDQQRKDTKKVDFEEGDVFSLDIVFSTGEGYPRTNETHRTTVFKKTEIQYALKTAAARATYSLIKKDFGAFPFAISNFEDESKAKLGLIEIEKNGLVEPYRVCYEQDGEDSVHVIITVLLLNNGPLKITGVSFDPEVIKSDKVIKDEEIKALLAQPVRNNKKKKKAAAAQ